MNENSRYDNERRSKVDKSHWDIRPYLSVGLTIVLVFLICILIFFAVLRYQGLLSIIKSLIKSMEAIIIGFIVAFLLNPLQKYFENKISEHLYKKAVKTQRSGKVVRMLSILIAYAIFIAMIAVLISIIVPQLVASIEELSATMNDKVQAIMGWIDKITKGEGALTEQINGLLNESTGLLQNWLQDNLVTTSSVITSVTSGVYAVVKSIFNVIIGVVVSIYVLMTKENFKGQFKKIVFAIFPPRYGNVVMEVVKKADDVFSGFFLGKIIDSIIIGCIAFVCLRLLKMPYYVLVSVIVGVTNIIPFFGPYIGAIPSAILILLVNPMKGVYFIIFILILQQIDGNIIGPRILGNTTGLSPFWVVFSILLFGGGFGVLGMVFGVPIFAMLYYLVKRVVEHILALRNLPQSTKEYVEIERIDLQTNRLMASGDMREYVMQREREMPSDEDKDK